MFFLLVGSWFLVDSHFSPITHHPAPSTKSTAIRKPVHNNAAIGGSHSTNRDISFSIEGSSYSP
jgi:hypothetical protein